MSLLNKALNADFAKKHTEKTGISAKQDIVDMRKGENMAAQVGLEPTTK
jgi:hypothetical protein